MRDGQSHAASVSMLIEASPAAIYAAFVGPEWLTRFWLRSANMPLAIGRTARWEFMVPGAETETTATRLEQDRALSWRWSDGTSTSIDLEPMGDVTAVTVVCRDFAGDTSEQVEAALNACEGFTIVLCDLKTLLETGTSAGLVASKARLIQQRAR